MHVFFGQGVFVFHVFRVYIVNKSPIFTTTIIIANLTMSNNSAKTIQHQQLH